MKKILSLLSAIAIVATSVVSLATITYADGEPTLRYDVVYDNAETPYAAGATGSINFYADNLGLISMDDMDTYFCGIDTVGITATLDTAYATSSKLKISSPALSNSTRNYTSGKATVQWGSTDFFAFPYDMSKALFTIKFTLAQELTAPVAVTVSDCIIRVANYDGDGNFLKNITYGQAGVTADEVLAVPTLTLGPAASAPATKYAVTVNGGTSDVAEAEEGQTVTVTATIPEGQQIKSVTGAALTEQSAGVYTFTMPAEAVTIVFEYEDIPAPEFSAEPSDLAPYYTADSVVVARKKVTMLNRTAANLTVEFTGEGKTAKVFNVELPVVNGEAADVFEAWVMNAPATWSINVAEVAAQ